MADEMKVALAKKVYGTLCNAIDAREWKYHKDEENLIVLFGVNGNDLPIQFLLAVDIERQLIRLLSPLPFKMNSDKLVEASIVCCVSSYKMVDGSFDLDLSDGTVSFRMTASFRDSVIGEALMEYMIDCSCAMVEKYNDQFEAINKGTLSIEEFIRNEA